jgi:hypothetical protein
MEIMIPPRFDSDVLYKAINQREKTEGKTRLYWEFGYIPRSMQIKMSYRYLKEVSEQSTDYPLDDEMYSLANIHLNSFYYNIFGAMDNLTWIIQHTFGVIKDINSEHIDEAHCKMKNISLFNKKFIEALNSINSDLGNIFQSYNPFHNHIRKTRDLTAHRIPLYIPAGYIHTQDQEKLKDEIKKYQVILNFDGTETMEEKDEAIYQSTIQLRVIHGFKKFRPVVARIDHSDNAKQEVFFQLGKTIEDDYEQFFNFSEKIIDAIEKGNLHS